MIKPHPCDSCGYVRKSGGQRMCNYYTMTGKRRPCPVGEACTIRQDPEAQAQAAEYNRQGRLSVYKR